MRLPIVIAMGIAVAGCVDDETLSTESISQAVTCPPTEAPAPYAPLGATPDSTPAYSWSAVAGATGYLWELLDSNGAHLGFAQYRTSTWIQGPDLSAHADVQLRWRVAGRCEQFGPPGPYSPWSYFRYVPPEPPPPTPTGTCYPSLKACLSECTGVCERRINCGGANAHKCFE